ncbi:hypothetical protein KBC03_02005 [Patescibacteria group bacterium]|nr:hypothetical protein [Patescibacteria group bacterium]
MLIGNTHYLDRYGSQILNNKLYTTVCTDNSPFPEEGYMVDIIGDYIIECSFPKIITENFTLFFQTILNLE